MPLRVRFASRRAALAGLACIGLAIALPAAAESAGAATAPYDVVIVGGRVIDPGTGFDRVRDVGIRNGRIAAIATRLSRAKTTIDARGLVVAPGFIDQHSHASSLDEAWLQARDGVTTALELEAGVYPVVDWYRTRRGRWPTNFGATSGHVAARQFLLGKDRGLYEASSAALTARLARLLVDGLKAGSLGFGFMANESPGATAAELDGLFAVAARSKTLVFYHPRTFDLAGNQEAIAWTRKHKGHLQIVHINSSSLADLPRLLPAIDVARAAGVDVTGELYPYTAASTGIESAIFDEGWQRRLGGIGYQDLEWPATNERLTPESFTKYRALGGPVVIHMMKEENVIKGLAHPGIMVASDAVPYENGGGHPRSAGSFSRVLGRYVRDLGVLSLRDALSKITYLPARRLELVAPLMKRKGRVRIGADADLTIFDAASIADRADFVHAARPSTGIRHVLVAGVPIIRDGLPVKTVAPGRAILGQPSGGQGPFRIDDRTFEN